MRLIDAALYRFALLPLFCCLGPAAQAQASAAVPPIESFFEKPVVGSPVLSPNGRYLAARASSKGSRDYLIVVELETMDTKGIAVFRDGDIGDFQWVNDDRLLFDIANRNVAQGDVEYAPGLYAINRDGTQFAQLALRRGDPITLATGTRIFKTLLPWHTFMLDQTGAQDSEYVYVQNVEFDNKWDMRSVSLLRLNTLTGAAQPVRGPARRVEDWMLDHKGEPRLAVGHDKNTTTIYYRDPATSEWRTLSQFDRYGQSEGFTPLGFGPDGTLYVAANAGENTRTLRIFDFAAGKVGKALVAAPGYDFAGSLVANRSKMLGVRLETDAASNVWLVPGMQAVQQAVDKASPGTVNLISVPAEPDSPWMLVRSYSDVLPSRYAIYNGGTGKFTVIGNSRPNIQTGQMGRQEPVRYKARDGLEIPGLLTLPPGGGRKNLPLVVMVHGGPWVRGQSWGWNAQSQFLATRGYAVLQPDFRGSTGFGSEHFTKGWKQWGLAMQNDIADGARWAIAQGIADPKRICIAGSSYGGYAVLMGLVNDPGLYRCGINWAGVTDINLMYDDTWYMSSDFSDEWKKYGMPVLIGDQAKDAAQLKATSPIEQAERITQPLLLAYGGADRRVPIFHGKKFRDAVTKTNRHVEWIEYPEEGHGWYLPKNRVDFWSRVEKFLEKNIGKPGASSVEPAVRP